MGVAGAAERPNILFCMADDWGWPHAGAYGDKGVKTPNFDRLAKEGILFHHAYTTSPSCTPSRNALFTGKYHWELGPGANLWSTLPVEHESFVHLLRDAGYLTGRSSQKSWGPGKIESWEAHHGDHPATKNYGNLKKFLDETKAGKEEPFFFWLATADPHRDYQEGSGVKAGIDPWKVHLFEHFPESEVIRRDVADYYFEVQRWDALVGAALDELERRGMLENTLIVMSGDHGMPFPRCKGNLYDSGVRVPLAIRWAKGIAENRMSEDFVSFADVAPTLLEIAGAEIPTAMSGTSFAGILRSEESGILEAEKRPFVVFGRERHVPAQEAPNMGGYPSRGIRDRELLYIRNYQPDWWPSGTGDQAKTNLPNQWFADCDGGPTKNHLWDERERDEYHIRAFQLCFGKRPAEELYYLGRDRGQIKNLAGNPAYAEVLERMRKTMEKRLAELNDPRAKDPGYEGFDGYPYFGGGGGRRKF